MSDSESEISNNVFTFQNVNTTVSARGPSTNISNFSFRNQLTSTMYMPRNFERQRYAESVSDQRSIYYRRETSPMSIHSACDVRPRNFQRYYSGMSSQQSVFNGRGGSPVSMRSIDSSASVSAADIAFAFKNIKFNKYDLKVIKEAYHKLMKQRHRKRIEKRRNMRMFLKGSTNRSGDDSGEQGSDSSLSSDDCRSVKTSYKENMSSSHMTRMDATEFRRTVKDNNLLKDRTDSFRQNTFKNIFSVGSNVKGHQNVNNSSLANKTHAIPTQRERFQSGFVLPSHRFNKSVASNVIPENTERRLKSNNAQNDECLNNNNSASISEEEIFSERTVRDTTVNNTQAHHKRSLESDDDLSLPDRKKSKKSSPKIISKSKTKVPSKTKNNINSNIESTNNFEFAKPSLPVRKSKSQVQEKVISKSKQPLTDSVEPTLKAVLNEVTIAEPVISPERSEISQPVCEQSELSQNSDVSLRPSFIKRKLFTQKLDVVEKANISSDNINSPQNVYSAIQKEKNKARKLVTTQSCMNREVQDDNNLLDLIHKIVPPDCINKTNQTSINQTRTDANKKDDDDNWDVSSVISMCNEKDVSDTFTDEEIFENGDKNKQKSKNSNPTSNSAKIKCNGISKPNTFKNIAGNVNLAQECKIVINKLPKNVINEKTNIIQTTEPKNMVRSSAKTFWDTDFESDAECQVTTQSSHSRGVQSTVNAVIEATKPEFKQPASRNPVLKNEMQVPETTKWLNNINNMMNSTIDSTRKFNISSLSVRSHRTSKKKKCCNDTCFQEIHVKTKSISQSSKPQNSVKNPAKPDDNCKITSNTPESSHKTISMPETKSDTISKPENNHKTTSKSERNSKTNSMPVSKTLAKTETNAQSQKKPEESNKRSSTKRNTGCIKPAAKSTTETDINKNRTSAKKKKPKSKSRNLNKSRSTSRTRTSPVGTKSNTDKETTSKKNVLNQTLTNRPIRSCRTPSQNRSTENIKSSRELKKNVETLLTTESKRVAKSGTEVNKNKSPGNKKMPKSTRNNDNSKSTSHARKSPRISKNNVMKEIRSKINLSNQSLSDRPMRSCRTPKQNSSNENSRSSRYLTKCVKTPSIFYGLVK